MPHCDKQMISFFITTKCNLDCIYCYTNKEWAIHKGQVLDFEFAKKGIDDYFATQYARLIRFQGGGEPTVEFPLVKKIIDYAKAQSDKAIKAEIQTNGCFSSQICEWIGANIDYIWLSCDGTPDIQNANRPFLGGGGSAEIFERNAKYLAQNCKEMVGVRNTITNQNVDRQIECIDYYASQGLKYIWVDPIFPVVGEQEVDGDFELMYFAEKFLEACKYARKNGIEYGSILTCNFDAKSVYACRACLPVPHLTTDGYISACDMALFGNDKGVMDLFYYGRWNSITKMIEYDEEKITYIRSRTVDNIPGCQECVAKYYCCGYCPGEVQNETKTYFGKKWKVCPAIKWLFVNMNDDLKKYTYSHP